MFAHRSLAVYPRSRTIARKLDLVAQRIPHRRLDLRSQLYRASSSIAFNLVEGADEFSPAEKARFYRMSRRSAAECAAILDLLEDLGAIAPDESSAVQSELQEIASMLAGLVKAVERKSRPE